MRYYLIILMIILTLSCSKNRVPKGILKEKEIIPVLVEIHLAEAIFAQRYSQESTRENYQEDLYLSVLRKYKIDQKIFEKSVLYYGKHPVKYKLVYDEVLNRLSEMNAKSRAKDSIKAKSMKAASVNTDTIQANKLKAESRTNDSLKAVRAKDSIMAEGVKVKPVIKETIKSNQAKSGNSDPAKINKTKGLSAGKDTVRLLK